MTKRSYTTHVINGQQHRVAIRAAQSVRAGDRVVTGDIGEVDYYPTVERVTVQEGDAPGTKVAYIVDKDGRTIKKCGVLDPVLIFRPHPG